MTVKPRSQGSNGISSFKKKLSIYFSQIHSMTMRIKFWQQHCNVGINT
jgi:hypothetical protein